MSKSAGGSFYYKTVIACNPPSQIFFVLGYMKAIKNNEGYKKQHQNSSSGFRFMMVSILPLEGSVRQF